MSDMLRIVLTISLGCYFCVVCYFLKKNIFTLKYALLWLLMGVILGIFLIVPELLTEITSFLGIELPINGLFTVCIGFCVLLLVALTAIVSGQSCKIRVLVQQVGILEERIRILEEKKNE